jgi:O-antigen/teichoic acid export membrane protein
VAGPDLLHLIVGDGFEGAYLPLRIITPLVLIIGIEQILVIQILMATHEDNIVLRNAFWGALVSIVLNILITSYMGAIGSAIVWFVAEFTIMILSIHAIYKKNHYLLPLKRMAAYIMAYLPLLLLSMLLYRCLENSYVMLVLLAIFVGIYALLIESFVLKNQVIKIFLKRK